MPCKRQMGADRGFIQTLFYSLMMSALFSAKTAPMCRAAFIYYLLLLLLLLIQEKKP